MFKAILTGIKNFFADDPDELGPEELVALVLDKEAPEARRKEGAECLSQLSDTISEMPASETIKASVSNRCFAKLGELLGKPGEPAWVYIGAVHGMNEIINIMRYDMDSAVLEAGVDPLIARLGSGQSDDMRSAAAMCLSSFDDEISAEATQRAIEAILVNVRQASGMVRADSLHSLGSFDSELTGHLWAEVATYLDDPSAEVRAHAASALWMIGQEQPDPAVIDKLIDKLESDPSMEVRDDCVNSIGQLGKGNPRAVAALVAALANPDLRHMAIFALMEFEEEAAAAVPALAKFLSDDEHEDSVVMALQSIGTDAARTLLRDNGHDEER
jgi:hypothetical protein